MMATVENTRLDVESIRILRSKVLSNNATAQDYELIEKFIANYGVYEYLTNKLKEKGIYTFGEYIQVRSAEQGSRYRLANGELLGVILGALDALENIVSK